MQVTTIGLDIAKNVFQVHGIDAKEKVVVRKQLRRNKLMAFFKALRPCLIGMEIQAVAHGKFNNNCRDICRKIQKYDFSRAKLVQSLEPIRQPNTAAGQPIGNRVSGRPAGARVHEIM